MCVCVCVCVCVCLCVCMCVCMCVCVCLCVYVCMCVSVYQALTHVSYRVGNGKGDQYFTFIFFIHSYNNIPQGTYKVFKFL